MAPAKLKRSSKSIARLNVTAVEFTKIYLVMGKRLALGISAYELSFMLGKNDFFVRDAENPLNTKHYNIDNTNFLLLIYCELLSSVTPPKTKQDIYHLEIKSYFNKIRIAIYEITIKDAKEDCYAHYNTFEVEDKHAELPTCMALFSFNEVLVYIDTLLAGEFFNEPKRALDIYVRCKTHFGESFHPRNMVKVLNFYTNKKSGVHKLNKDKRDGFGRVTFGKRNKIHPDENG